MKKILTHLTGIVFVITILVAGACTTGEKQKDTPTEEKSLTTTGEDSTVRVYLKDREINGVMHLEMSDSWKPECLVIDNLETVVFPGYTVIFMKAHNSKVKEVTDIRLLDDVFAISREDVQVDSGLYVIVIDPDAQDSIIVKYEIEFTVKKDTYTIDPYLRIPDDTSR